MKSRCADNPKSISYKYYAGKGVTICERWTNPHNGFVNFLLDMGKRPAGKSIDRIDVDGNYEPSNCRWATATQQANNKTTSPEYLAKFEARLKPPDDALEMEALEFA